jgi:hypothetical protein
VVSKLEEYMFDLNGYLLVEGALGRGEVAELNAGLEAIPHLEPGEWYGYIQREKFEESRGIAWQQIYEAGEPFERLIDHPSWHERVTRFVGGEGTFDYNHGPLFIDESFATFRSPGQAIGLHAGGYDASKKQQYRVQNGTFMCGQVNVLIALNDIGPGDGATMVIPGSHKSNFPHPQFGEHAISEGASVEGTAGAIEVYMKAGDAILFVDAIAHGSAKRSNPGQRRFIVYRYGSTWNFFRWGYRPSPELLARLRPVRRQMVWPWQEWERVPNRKPEHLKR